jgi:hypothetical protein
MDDEWVLEKMRAALRKLREMPPGEYFKDMVCRGVIDEQGNVLLLKGQTPPGEEPEPEEPPAASANGPAAPEATPPQPTKPTSE